MNQKFLISDGRGLYFFCINNISEPRFDTGFVYDTHPEETALGEADEAYKRFGLDKII